MSRSVADLSPARANSNNRSSRLVILSPRTRTGVSPAIRSTSWRKQGCHAGRSQRRLPRHTSLNARSDFNRVVSDAWYRSAVVVRTVLAQVRFAPSESAHVVIAAPRPASGAGATKLTRFEQIHPAWREAFGGVNGGYRARLVRKAYPDDGPARNAT
jgi:hypothetical protein